MITASITEIAELLEYQPSTGHLIWKGTKGHCVAGKRAGNVSDTGYRNVRVLGKLFREHRVVWALCTGSWPEQGLDHINGIKADNRIENLREATNSENARNRRAWTATGYKGVTWNKHNARFQAQIGHNKKNNHLGYFDTAEEAYAAYCAAAERLHGEFAKL